MAQNSHTGAGGSVGRPAASRVAAMVRGPYQAVNATATITATICTSHPVQMLSS